MMSMETLAFDGRWLHAGSRFLKLTRRASKRERLQYGCSHMPRYDRSLFLRYVLPRLNGHTLVSAYKLRRERDRRLAVMWPQTCVLLGFAVVMVRNALLS